MSTSPIVIPQFRIYFALQQAVVLAKARTTQAQVFSRFSIPSELRLRGSFTQFVTLIGQLIKLSISSYQQTAAHRLVFVTADYLVNQLTIRVTDGGSGLRYQTGKLLGDKTLHSHSTPQRILAETELTVRSVFRGQLLVKTFPQRGTQVTIQLPVPTYTQTPDTS